MRKTLLALVLLALGAVGGWWIASPTAGTQPSAIPSTSATRVPAATSAEVRGLPTLAPMLRGAMPAVVSIIVQARKPTEDNSLYNDPFYRRFFGDRTPSEQQVLAAGSGVVIDAERGWVLTNSHVVKGAVRIGVVLSDGRRVEAKLIGADEPTDIALLSVNAKGLTALVLDDSDKLQIGDYAVAIGNPFGLGQTVTFGIISALGRSGLGIEGYEDFIQTDAAVNPGNSGGALIDLDGRLIGINTAIVGPTGANIGIGFAIASNMARQVADQLGRYGKVKRGQLGVTIQDHLQDMPGATPGEAVVGAMVASVAPGSAAEKAGIQPGDIIVEVEGKPIVSAAQLSARVGLLPVGEPFKIAVQRRGNRLELDASVLGTPP